MMKIKRLLSEIIKKKLNNKYKEPPQKISWSLLVVIAVPIFIVSGLTYLYSFLGVFGVFFENYFTIEDALNVLYLKFLSHLYLVSFVWLAFGLLLFYLLNFVDEKRYNNNKKKIIEMVAITFLLTIYFCLFKAIENYKDILYLLLLMFFVLIMWFFQNKQIALITLVSCFCPILNKMGEADGIKASMNKTTFNIVLKDNDTILKERDKNRYFIYKTTNYIFIMDERHKDNPQVIVYPTTEIQKMSFNFIKE